jgi:predicted transcriptional regulator
MAKTIEIDDELNARLSALAADQNRAPDAILADAIAQYSERSAARKKFLDDGEASFAHYQATGLHLTGDEVFTWLRSWGTVEETDAPECHT